MPRETMSISRRTLGLVTLGAATMTVLNSAPARAVDTSLDTSIPAATVEESKAFLLSMMPTVEQFKAASDPRTLTADRDIARALRFVNEGLAAIGRPCGVRRAGGLRWGSRRRMTARASSAIRTRSIRFSPSWRGASESIDQLGVLIVLIGAGLVCSIAPCLAVG